MALTTYSELQIAIGNHLNRTDMLTVAPDLITLAEAKFNRDHRLRNIVQQSISPDADDHALPESFRELISLAHDSDSYIGPIVIVSPDELSNHRRRHGPSNGVPTHAAIIGTATKLLRFAPVPGVAYAMQIVYNSSVTPLSDSLPSNWLLAKAPDIYLYGALVEAEAFLQEDQRVMLWKQMVEDAIQRHYINQERAEYGGTLSRFPANAIGSKV